jgi:hypothetical protein
VIFFYLHKAPAHFRRSRGNNFPFSSVPIWSYGITFTWPFLDVPPFFCSRRMRSAGQIAEIRLYLYSTAAVLRHDWNQEV